MTQQSGLQAYRGIRSFLDSTKRHCRNGAALFYYHSNAAFKFQVGLATKMEFSAVAKLILRGDINGPMSVLSNFCL